MFSVAPDRRTCTLDPDSAVVSDLSLATLHSAPSTALPSAVSVSIVTAWLVPFVTDAQPVRIDNKQTPAHRPQNRPIEIRISTPLVFECYGRGV